MDSERERRNSDIAAIERTFDEGGDAEIVGWDLGPPYIDKGRIQRTGEIIIRQVRHMTSLVDDLLDVSRVSRGLVDLDRISLDVRQIVTEAVE